MKKPYTIEREGQTVRVYEDISGTEYAYESGCTGEARALVAMIEMPAQENHGVGITPEQLNGLVKTPIEVPPPKVRSTGPWQLADIEMETWVRPDGLGVFTKDGHTWNWCVRSETARNDEGEPYYWSGKSPDYKSRDEAMQHLDDCVEDDRESVAVLREADPQNDTTRNWWMFDGAKNALELHITVGWDMKQQGFPGKSKDVLVLQYERGNFGKALDKDARARAVFADGKARAMATIAKGQREERGSQGTGFDAVTGTFTTVLDGKVTILDALNHEGPLATLAGVDVWVSDGARQDFRGRKSLDIVWTEGIDVSVGRPFGIEEDDGTAG